MSVSEYERDSVSGEGVPTLNEGKKQERKSEEGRGPCARNAFPATSNP